MRKPMTSKRPSFYTGDTPKADASAANQAVWQAVRDLVAIHDAAEPGEDPPLPCQVDQRTWTFMAEEARRVLHGTRAPTNDSVPTADQCILLELATGNVAWALRCTQERNPKVIARFAVEVAFDRVFRLKVASTLTVPTPSNWRWEGGRHRCSPDLDGFNWPILHRDYAALRAATDKYVIDDLNHHNQVEPYCGLTATYPWAMDAVRPPVAAIRTASGIISQHSFNQACVGHLDFNQAESAVLCVELGHAVAAQALSVFLPEHEVQVASPSFGPRCHVPAGKKFAAVVVNVPGPAAVAFVRDIVANHAADRPQLMHRWDMDRYWSWPPADWGTQCQAAVQFGLDHLADGGVLVLLTDILSGQFHVAKQVIEANGGLQQVEVVPGKHMAVSFGYASKPWGLYGCPRPTERLLTVWRRAA